MTCIPEAWQVAQMLEAGTAGGPVWVEIAPGDLRRVISVTHGDDVDGWCTYIILEPKQMSE